MCYTTAMKTLRQLANKISAFYTIYFTTTLVNFLFEDCLSLVPPESIPKTHNFCVISCFGK